MKLNSFAKTKMMWRQGFDLKWFKNKVRKIGVAAEPTEKQIKMYLRDIENASVCCA